VEFPFPGLIRNLLNLAAQNPYGADMDAFIFWEALKADKPIEERLLLDGLRDALVETGMSRETAKVYTFHAWRHFFTAYMRPRIDEKLPQKQTGHKTLLMLDQYAEKQSQPRGHLGQTAAMNRFYFHKNPHSLIIELISKFEILKSPLLYKRTLPLVIAVFTFFAELRSTVIRIPALRKLQAKHFRL
jgi:hypothetical protein